MHKAAIPVLLAMLIIMMSAPWLNAEKTKHTKASFVIKVVEASKGDKEQIPPELKDFGDALKDSTELNVFKQYRSFDMTAEFGEETDQKLDVLEYKLVLKPTSFEKDELKATVSVVKIDAKKTKTLVNATVAMGVDGIVCINLGKHSDGELIVALKLTKVE